MTTPAPGRLGSRAVALAKAAHPGPCLTVTALGAALAVTAGLSPARVLLLAAALLSGQLAVGWTNDLLDEQRDRAAGRQDKPLAQGALQPSVVRAAAWAAGAACVPLSLANGWRSGAVHLVAVASALGYDAGLKRTVWSFAPFAVSFGLLPAVVTLALPGHPWPPAWALAAAALLGVGAHLANALPDLDDDRRLGVHGLPQRLGERRTRALAATLVLVAALVLAFAPPGPVRVQGAALLLAAAALLAVAFAVRWPPGSRAAFTLTAGGVVVVVLLLLLRGSSLA